MMSCLRTATDNFDIGYTIKRRLRAKAGTEPSPNARCLLYESVPKFSTFLNVIERPTSLSPRHGVKRLWVPVELQRMGSLPLHGARGSTPPLWPRGDCMGADIREMDIRPGHSLPGFAAFIEGQGATSPWPSFFTPARAALSARLHPSIRVLWASFVNICRRAAKRAIIPFAEPVCGVGNLT